MLIVADGLDWKSSLAVGEVGLRRLMRGRFVRLRDAPAVAHTNAQGREVRIRRESLGSRKDHSDNYPPAPHLSGGCGRAPDLGSGHLAFGLVCTWLVGIGRWWDDPEAKYFQHLGVGSVGYVFVLALLTYLLVRPLRPKNWWYPGVLTYITLTSLPAALYALPVERWVDWTPRLP